MPFLDIIIRKLHIPKINLVSWVVASVLGLFAILGLFVILFRHIYITMHSEEPTEMRIFSRISGNLYPRYIHYEDYELKKISVGSSICKVL